MSALPIAARAPRSQVALALAAVFGPLAVLAGVWLPVILHYHVPTPAMPAPVVARLQAEPADAVLARLDEGRNGVTRPDGAEVQVAADEILQGRYRTRAGEVVPVGLEPTPALLATGSPMAQLQVSSLAVTQVLLDAYRQTGEERYFDAALRSALAWARFERSAWLPAGFLWNDHAIAARVVPLTQLWREYRRRPDFDAARGAELLTFVARSAELLARHSHYTARTNHGIMQNLALLHVAAAFPGLPGTEGHVALAIDRLARHLPYYVTPEGVVLEHSAGYQDFAIRLLELALGYADLLGVAPPADLAERYEAARCFRRHFTRPDGTVPNYGDTSSARPTGAADTESPPPRCAERGPAWIDADFGYASMRGFVGEPDQLFVTWADFAGRAHKHDDELAAWLWLDGRDWWAGSGYWPYGDPSWRDAVSWRGANAPHAVGEQGGRARVSRLLGVRATGPVPFLDLERRVPGGAVYRRQLVGLGDSGVLVLDSAAGDSGAGRFETVWTFAPGIAVRPVAGAPQAYDVIDVPSGRALQATFFGGANHGIERLRGSRRPFGGLVARDGEIHAVEAVIATADFGAWYGALWQPARAAGHAGPAPVAANWTGPERWSVALAGPGGPLTLLRDGAQLTLRATDGAGTPVAITAGPVNRPGLESATAQYGQVAAQFPVFRDYFKYRVRATLAIGILFACQFAGLWLLARFGAGRGMRCALLVAAWAMTGWWLYDQYLV